MSASSRSRLSGVSRRPSWTWRSSWTSAFGVAVSRGSARNFAKASPVRGLRHVGDGRADRRERPRRAGRGRRDARHVERELELGPVHADVPEADGVELRGDDLGPARERQEDVGGRVVAVDDHRFEQLAERERDARRSARVRRSALRGACRRGPGRCSGSSRTAPRSARESSSTATASLKTLAIGKRSLPWSEAPRPVSRSRTETPTVPPAVAAIARNFSSRAARGSAGRGASARQRAGARSSPGV